MKNANRVPALEMSASTETGNRPANSDTAMPVIQVTTMRGVELQAPRQAFSGSRPSRDIVNRMRVWPKIIISTTDGGR